MLHIAYKYQRATQLKIPIMIIAVLVLRFCREHIYKLCFCINSCCFSQFFAARCYASVRPMRSCVDCLSVCLSVTFVDHIKTNKHIFEIFSLSGSQAILVFPCQTEWRHSDGNPHNWGVECRWGRQKSDSGRISGFAAYRSTVLSTVRVAKCEK